MNEGGFSQGEGEGGDPLAAPGEPGNLSENCTLNPPFEEIPAHPHEDELFYFYLWKVAAPAFFSLISREFAVST